MKSGLSCVPLFSREVISSYNRGPINLSSIVEKYESLTVMPSKAKPSYNQPKSHFQPLPINQGAEPVPAKAGRDFNGNESV
jgi:hypothetical protein